MAETGALTIKIRADEGVWVGDDVFVVLVPPPEGYSENARVTIVAPKHVAIEREKISSRPAPEAIVRRRAMWGTEAQRRGARYRAPAATQGHIGDDSDPEPGEGRDGS